MSLPRPFPGFLKQGHIQPEAGIVPAWCLNLTAADGGFTFLQVCEISSGDSRLLRREGGAKLWEARRSRTGRGSPGDGASSYR